MAERVKRYWLFIHPKECDQSYAGMGSFLAAYNTFASAADEGKKSGEYPFQIVDTQYGLIWYGHDLDTAKQLLNMY